MHNKHKIIQYLYVYMQYAYIHKHTLYIFIGWIGFFYIINNEVNVLAIWKRLRNYVIDNFFYNLINQHGSILFQYYCIFVWKIKIHHFVFSIEAKE